MGVGTLSVLSTREATGLDELLAETLGDSRICIAVLDGPVDCSHPCFEGANLTQVATLAPGHSDSGPASRHGTHVASVIFGARNGPVPGIAPGCRGVILPIFTDGPHDSIMPCSQLDLARAITQALDHGAHVINISGGQLEPSGIPGEQLARVVRLCAEQGALIVASAGNDGCQCLHIPAAVPSVLVVGAMDSSGSPLESSNWGPSYQTQGVLAPGENILGAVPGGGTTSGSGTSFATPIVSGVAGLLLSLQLKRGHKPDPRAVRQAVLESAIACNAQEVSDCRRYLAGKLNIAGAFRLITQRTPPAISIAAHIGAHAAGEPQQIPGGTNNMSNSTNEDVSYSSAGASENFPPEAPPRQIPKLAAQPVEGATASQEEAPPWTGNRTPVSSDAISPAECSCGAGGGRPGLVYALGLLGHDFGTEARRDSFIQHGLANPHDPGQLLAHLQANPSHASALTWTLTQETTAIYAVQPVGPFAAQTYEVLRQFYGGQLAEGVERVSIPGVSMGKVTLMNGQVVPVILPELRGMYSWSTQALVNAVVGKPPANKDERQKYDLRVQEIANFLERIYYETRNLGVAPQERAMNYAATNAFQIENVYRSALEADLRLDSIGVERSPICRPESDCWDVKLIFFHPMKRMEQARMVYRFTVDVSDVVPVTVGKVRHWHLY